MGDVSRQEHLPYINNKGALTEVPISLLQLLVQS